MTPTSAFTNSTEQSTSIRSDVLAGIRKASLSTGVDFSYLMAQANRESSFNPTAQAKSSSAAGLYQFVEQTWLGVVKHHGAEHGQAEMADKIGRRSDGRFFVADPNLRKEILNLRRDPAFAAAMAAEHAADNKAKLEEKLGRKVNGTDLYMAHFLGISGALKFLRAVESSPERIGASLLPKAASANQNVFFTKEGQARTVLEIYNRFDSSMDADIAAYASLENSEDNTVTMDAGLDKTHIDGASTNSLMADLSLQALPSAAFLNRLNTISAGTESVTTARATSGTAHNGGLGKVGSLLSPLMLVTLAALPTADADEDTNKNEVSSQSNATAKSGSLFNRLDNPLHFDLLRTGAVT